MANFRGIESQLFSIEHLCSWSHIGSIAHDATVENEQFTFAREIEIKITV